VADLLDRRAEPGLVVIGCPARSESPEHVGRADDEAGVSESRRHRADVRADAEDLLQQQHGADRRVRRPHEHVHRAGVAARHLL
jgi:hypothetical protein